MQITETWRQVPGYEGLYAVSNLGRIQSLPKMKHTPQGKMFVSKPKFLKPSKINSGYLIVTLCNNGKSERKLVHILTAEVYVDNPNGYGFVNHEDGNKENNAARNLSWCTRSMNMQHAYETGLIRKRRRRQGVL
jgi:hypothetical protein